MSSRRGAIDLEQLHALKALRLATFPACRILRFQMPRKASGLQVFRKRSGSSDLRVADLASADLADRNAHAAAQSTLGAPLYVYVLHDMAC